MPNPIALRPYQHDSVEKLRAKYASGRRAPLLVLPTGGGKTFVFTFIASSAVARGSRVLILVHRQELLRQSSESLASMSVAHGRIAQGQPMNFREAVQVASVQTVIRRFDIMAKAAWEPDLIIVDEAHHATAGSWRQVIEQWPKARVLGVTATPCRMDGKGLGIEAGGVFDEIVIGPEISLLTELGYLSPADVYAPPMAADLSGLRTRAGDFEREESAARMDKPTVTGDAVAHYARLCNGVPAIAFCVSVAHADHVAEQFRSAGWKAEAVDGGMDDGTRKARIADLAAGRLNVLTSCDIISEGTDIPVVGAAILLRPTQSVGLYLQQVGRALRPYPGKASAVILDHVGNVARHGLPDDSRDWSLDGRKKKSRAANDNEGPPPPLTCTQCFRQMRQPAPPVCPHCGQALAAAKNRMDKLEHAPGELKKIGAEERESMRKNRMKEQSSAHSLESLVALGQRRGYASPQGWAMKIFASRGARKYG